MDFSQGSARKDAKEVALSLWRLHETVSTMCLTLWLKVGLVQGVGDFKTNIHARLYTRDIYKLLYNYFLTDSVIGGPLSSLAASGHPEVA